MPAAQQLSHVYPLGSRVNDRGVLEVGGCDLVELAREFGTPCYVVAEDDVRRRARAFMEAFAARTDDFEVVFASKAFPCTAVYRLLWEEGIGCDVAGGGELAMALAAGVDPARIHLHGNAKSLGELRAARAAGVGDVIVDNLRDIELLEALVAQDGGPPQHVSLRVAPGISPETHPAISTGGPNTKFGFDLAHAPAGIERIQASGALELGALHLHIGSQILDLEPFRAALQALAALGADVPAYNLGGGLGVAYLEHDRPPTIEEYVAMKVDAVHDIIGPGKRVLDEPGRALVANAGVTLYEVQTIKRNVETYVAVDGGMSDNLRPMLYNARYEVDVASRPGGGTRCHVVGKHCESGDILVRDADLADPRPGDILVTPATGAYGHAMANTYNGALRPPVVFASGGDARLVVRRDTYEDLLARDV
ncbi:MAG: diaminopimelate decarboxylase [Solirubrobacteraceae bacterium]|nr:diaminopimelate decarboxylase [Solirubrobacteraceae bacterium]MCU0312442.1 diaminopimelate decarboxylase [Solirubrobacteraceae bacterium]